MTRSKMLDVGIGALRRVADNREHFITGHNQCYGYIVPPMLGGEYAVANFEPTVLSVHYSFLADIYQQTKDVPDGAQIRPVLRAP
jgi:hypothetical protein